MFENIAISLVAILALTVIALQIYNIKSCEESGGIAVRGVYSFECIYATRNK